MTITEILLPVLKGDPESLSAYNSQSAQISKHLAGTSGLQFFAHGTIVFDGGNPVAPESGRTILIIEWDTLSSLHAFYPHSAAFQAFLGLMKPFLAQGDTPKVFEAVTSAAKAASAPITQIVKVQGRSDTEELWTRLQAALSSDAKHQGVNTVFAHAVGVEGQEGEFMGTIGWQSLEDYERVRTDETVRSIMRDLGAGHDGVDLVIRFERITVS
ncbi:hypothetical protein BJX64DRAFT_291284 [Aspergillus heterothallicus]